MPPFPVDIIDDALDYAAIGIAAIAAIGTLVAVAVAVWQTTLARSDAKDAQREAGRLRREAAEREERHHREIVAIEAGASERERLMRLDAFARDAARVSGVERVRLTCAPAIDSLAGLDADSPEAQTLKRQLSIGFFNGTDAPISIRMRIEGHWVDLRSRMGDRAPTAIVLADKWYRHLAELDSEDLRDGPEVEVYFTDSRSNQWRIDRLNDLHLTNRRLVQVEDANVR